jgi:uncharacterized membrane protein (GlpM family)
MQIVIRAALSLVVILVATTIGKKVPSAAGLIGVMPLTGALVLVWTYLDADGNPKVMQEFTKGALWGTLPSILFFFVAFFCFKRNLPVSVALGVSFGVWLVGAFVHRWLLR